MVLKREVIQVRLEDLDRTLMRLARHRHVELAEYETNLDLQWIVERGLLKAAGLVFDVADQVLSGHFGQHAATYQASLDGLRQEGVLSGELHQDLHGLGGFRNLLVHEYLDLDHTQIHRYLQDAFNVFPRFGREVLAWMDGGAADD